MALKASEKEIAWLAGFIDGEGYLGIERQRKNAKRIYGPYRGVTSYTIEEEIYQKLRTLNKRGLPNSS